MKRQTLSHVHGSKQVNGAYAYYLSRSTKGECWFGVSFGQNWLLDNIKGQCPNGPDDHDSFKVLIQKLWDKYVNEGLTWKQMIANGGRSRAFVEAFQALAKEYGLTLVP